MKESRYERLLTVFKKTLEMSLEPFQPQHLKESFQSMLPQKQELIESISHQLIDNITQNSMEEATLILQERECQEKLDRLDQLERASSGSSPEMAALEFTPRSPEEVKIAVIQQEQKAHIKRVQEYISRAQQSLELLRQKNQEIAEANQTIHEQIQETISAIQTVTKSSSAESETVSGFSN